MATPSGRRLWPHRRVGGCGVSGGVYVGFVISVFAVRATGYFLAFLTFLDFMTPVGVFVLS